MDNLLFRIELRPNNPYGIVSIPIINGQSLIEIIKEIEINYEPQIAGAYDGIRPDLLLEELCNGSYHDTTKSKILECECGADGCWSLLMKITKTENSIVWSNFNQLHRESWDYSHLKSFEFDIQEYKVALRQLRNAI